MVFARQPDCCLSGADDLQYSCVVPGSRSDLPLDYAATPVLAQADHAHPAAPAPAGWEWSWDANVFAGWNYQYRKFRDFQEVESQNWLMGAGERPLGRGKVRLHAMLSFEPFTIRPTHIRSHALARSPRGTSTIS